MAASNPSTTQRLGSLLRGPLPVAGLLLCFLALGLSAAVRESPTFDEGNYLVGGYSFWATGDYRLHPENGNWVLRWEALPLWLHGYNFPASDAPGWQQSKLWNMADQFMYGSGNDADAMVWRARLMVAVLGVLLGLVVYFWSRSIFGPAGGLISLSLYAFSPAMLANGFLATSDMAASLGFAAATWSLWAVLQRVTPLTIGLSSLALAALFLFKFSAALIVPIGLLLLAARLANPQPLPVKLSVEREFRGRLRQLAIFVGVMAVQVFIVFVMIWATFGFRYSMLGPLATPNDELAVPWEKLHAGSQRADDAIATARKYHLLPEAYLYGFAYTLWSSSERWSFLNGEFSYRGRLAFFPWCFALKTPLPVFFMLAIAAMSAWFCRTRTEASARGSNAPSEPSRAYQVVPLVVLLAVYWLVAVLNNLNIGHRHILPTYPPLFVLAGAAGLWWPSRHSRTADATNARKGSAKAPSTVAAPVEVMPAGIARARVMRGVVVLILAAAALETVWYWPHYLAYFNGLAGGPRQAYRRLVDSSLDWGQDLPALARWLASHPQDTADPQRLYLSYFGTANPKSYGIEATLLPGFHDRRPFAIPLPLTGGTYCISATMLECAYLRFPGRWNAEYEQIFQVLRSRVEPFWKMLDDPARQKQYAATRSQEEWNATFREYEQLRLARLCSYLRNTREPDDEVGYSILIYRVSDDDLRQALNGPPVELLSQPEDRPRNGR